VRPAAEDAVRRIGFEPGLVPARVLFVNLAGLGVCPSPTAGTLVIGYVTARPLTAAAHTLHGCCAQVLELRLLADGPAFTTALVPPALEAAGLTPREADALALLLAGATDRRIATTLGVAPSTARSHVRAVLRKAGVADRRALLALDHPRAPAGAAGTYSGVGARDAPSGLRAFAVQVRRDSPHGPEPPARR
jgi:DNA-binding CsgD family transcriptional regulator